jgi:preprotein translocase subunit SecF
MDVITPAEMNEIIGKSKIHNKYEEAINRESASEMLIKKLEAKQKEQEEQKAKEEQAKEEEKPQRHEKSVIEQAVNSSVGRTVVRELTRGLLGVLGIGSTRRKKSSWF